MKNRIIVKLCISDAICNSIKEHLFLANEFKYFCILAHEVKVKYIRPNVYQISVDNGEWKYVKGSLDKNENDFHLSCQIADTIKKCVVFKNDEHVYVFGDVS